MTYNVVAKLRELTEEQLSAIYDVCPDVDLAKVRGEVLDAIKALSADQIRNGAAALVQQIISTPAEIAEEYSQPEYAFTRRERVHIFSVVIVLAAASAVMAIQQPTATLFALPIFFFCA